MVITGLNLPVYKITGEPLCLFIVKSKCVINLFKITNQSPKSVGVSKGKEEK
jgi:hypothetical protein